MKSCADLLKADKATVNPDEVGVHVKDLKRSTNGGLFVTIQNGHDKAQILKRELMEKVPNALILVSRNKWISKQWMSSRVWRK